VSQQCIEATNASVVENQAEHPDEFVLLSSGKTAWDGILLEHLQFPPLDISDACAVSHHLTLQLGMPKQVELKANGKFSQKQLLPGNVCITPVQQLHSVRWQGNMEVLSMTLEPKFVAQAVQESVNPDRVELIMRFRNYVISYKTSQMSRGQS